MEEKSLEQTPTWAVATAASLFVAVSFIMERSLHGLGKYLKRRNQKHLLKALQKMKGELMVLGFISLLVAVLQRPVSNICVPYRFANHWLPCKLLPEADKLVAPPNASASEPGFHSRKLLMNGAVINHVGQRRILTMEATESCMDKGKAPLVSYEGLHQLHIFIFVLAVVHVAISGLTMLLGFVKIHHWKKWEIQTREEDYESFFALRDMLLQKEPVACLGRYSPRGQSPFFVWMRCFLNQFVGSVSKSDYLTFRLAFLSNHNLTNKFDFYNYVTRSMEHDFKAVVGISCWLWAFVILFMLLNVHGWYTYFWMAFIPLILVLVVGTKQQHIISILATEARADVLEAQGSTPSKKFSKTPTIKTRDELFWFKYPGLLLHLIHFILFQNSFELAVFFWLLRTFGWSSCFFENRALIFVRVIAGLLTQVLSSYSTLPLYALVNQMGSDYKPTIFKKSVQSALQGWHGKARQKQKEKARPEQGNLLHHFLNAAQEIMPVHIETHRSATIVTAPQEHHQDPVQSELANPVEQAIPTTASPLEEESSAAQKAGRDKFLFLYGKLGAAAKVQDAASS